MRLKTFISVFVLFLMLVPLAISQSKETGAVVGTVMDDQGEPLPGVAVTLTSPNLIGTRSAITDDRGNYRFPALPPGLYAVKAELQGFGTVVQENIRVTTTVSLTVDVTIKPSVVEAEVTVIAKAPTVDVKSTETASVTLTEDLLKNVPFSNFAMDIINLAPGVTNDVAYGASESTGVAYQIDGVDVSDPEAGSAWVFNDPNIIEEVKVMALGLPAEYGNFTGVVFNQVTKSGGNEFSGFLHAILQGKAEDGKFWQANNNSAYIDDFPELTPPAQAITDFAANVGGPILRDKIWFFLGGQYYDSKNYPTGFPEPREYKQPRGFLKITAQLTPSTNINSFIEVDVYNGINRGGGATTDKVACVDQKSPDLVGNFSLTHIINEKTFFDFKTSFFHGYYYLDPEVGPDINAHFNENDNMLYDSAGYFFYADRDRIQANTSLTHYAEDFLGGDHDFKFGAEFEYGKVRNRYGYTGRNNMFYDDLTGYGAYGYYYTGNYLAFQYEGYDTNTQYKRLEGFAQDSWKVSDRLNINLGARLTQGWGTVKDVSGTVYSIFRVAPRLGFTFDIFGDKTTIFKAHYGQFTEAMLSSYHDRLNPASAYTDAISYYWDTWDNDWVEYQRIVHEALYSIDSNIKHPYMDQITVGIERELFEDASFSATFIYRNWKNIIGRIDTLAEYSPIDVYVEELNKSFTIYERDNPNEHAYVMKNIEKGDPWINVDPYRKYMGIELLFNKRFSNNWQLLASYVYSQATGSMNNGFGDDIGWGGSTDDPNFWINSDGNSTADPTHMLKIQGTYVFPLGIQLNAHFHAITGYAWTQQYRTSRLNQGRVTFLTEKRGSNHYDIQKILDLRLEKTFTFAEKYRLGLMLDVFNVFNADKITSWGTRIGYDWTPGDSPSTDGHNLLGITRPRQARIGIRFSF